jgi:hypothetical protein
MRLVSQALCTGAANKAMLLAHQTPWPPIQNVYKTQLFAPPSHALVRPPPRPHTQVDHGRDNVEKARRQTAQEVMSECLARGSRPGVDPASAQWADLAEPALSDVAYSEARRGAQGLGDEVPAHTFLFRWALCVTASVALGEEVGWGGGWWW